MAIAEDPGVGAPPLQAERGHLLRDLGSSEWRSVQDSLDGGPLGVSEQPRFQRQHPPSLPDSAAFGTLDTGCFSGVDEVHRRSARGAVTVGVDHLERRVILPAAGDLQMRRREAVADETSANSGASVGL
jgi:hypothetical protein